MNKLTMPLALTILGTILVAAAAGTARAQSPGAASAARFGDKGHVVINAQARGVFQYTSTKPPGGGTSSSVTEVELSPGLLYFVADNVAVGGKLTFQSTDRGGISSNAVGLGATVGVNIPLGASVVSWMPQLGLGFLRVGASQGPVDASGFVILGELAAPFLFHLAPHFFLGVGPGLTYTLVSEIEDMASAKVLQFGVLAQIGGWL